MCLQVSGLADEHHWAVLLRGCAGAEDVQRLLDTMARERVKHSAVTYSAGVP